MHGFSVVAYIDPGSGTIILQVLLAGMIGALAGFRSIKHVVLSWFGGAGKSGESAEELPEQEPPSQSDQQPARRAG